MSEDTKLDLAAIKAKCAAATEGPWTSGEPHQGRFVGTTSHKSAIAECRSASGCWSSDPMAVANGHFIAHARTDVPALVAEVERLRFLLAECFRITGADPDGNDDEMLATKAVEAVRRLRAESDKDVEAAESRVEELEAAVRSLADSYSPVECLDGLDRVTEICGCCGYGWDGACEADPGECPVRDARSLLAKGGAA